MATSVEQFHELTMKLIVEAMEYAKGGVFVEETDANIRAVRINTQVLMSALGQAQLSRPPHPLAPPVETPEATAAKRR